MFRKSDPANLHDKYLATIDPLRVGDEIVESGQLEVSRAEEYVSGHVCAIAGSAVNIVQVEGYKGQIMFGNCPAVVVSAVVHEVPIGSIEDVVLLYFYDMSLESDE